MAAKKDELESSDAEGEAIHSLSEHIDHNIESMVEVQRKERNSTGPSQLLVEKFSLFIARPAYLLGLVLFVIGWIAANLLRPWGVAPIDPAPFEILDGLLTFSAVVTTTIVLIAQNRQAKLEQQHRHLDLQVGLLTEQKVTKLIHLVEELRRDLPMVKDREDRQAAALQESADAAAVISAIEEVGLTGDTAPQKKMPGAARAKSRRLTPR
jgi:uncharacterized membrane protein